ncbi:MAG: cytochrome c biogenesis protein CcdA [Candidatus Aquilonibacter sp.]|jgi:cytochrome c biogenesis protein CcdA
MLALVVSAFLAGLATSLGPCVAPRFLALAALVANMNGRRRWLRVICFMAGLLLCYGMLAVTASLVGAVVALSRFLYVGLALYFLGLGLRALVVAQSCDGARLGDSRPGSVVIVGGAMGLVFSPCCTPVAGLMATVAVSGSLFTALLAVLAFGLGHVTPLATVGVGLNVGERSAFRHALNGAMDTIGGGLSLALVCYYGILA